MDVLHGRTPAQVWAELTPVPVSVDGDAVMRPSEEATVRRQQVRLHNRFYFHEALALYDGHKVTVEYDLHHDRNAWVHDAKGRLICVAKLVNTIGVLPTSRLEEGRDRRQAEQLKRLQRKADEAVARRADPITADDQARGIEALAAMALPPPTPPAPSADVIDVDLLSWRTDQ
jgi:putative transposase